ncbi:MAG TPA: hypothetical protein VJT13_21245 [Xanthobacteraceae bacterium]|nr:hypothetical protein [Xanthobacteraceae bacterium]
MISASDSKLGSIGWPSSFDTRSRAARRPTSSLDTRTVVIGIGNSDIISISSYPTIGTSAGPRCPLPDFLAPGIDLEKDVPQWGFRPRIASDLKRMDKRPLMPAMMSLPADIEAKVQPAGRSQPMLRRAV